MNELKLLFELILKSAFKETVQIIGLTFIFLIFQ